MVVGHLLATRDVVGACVWAWLAFQSTARLAADAKGGGVVMVETSIKRRRWFQIHLSTAIVLNDFELDRVRLDV